MKLTKRLGAVLMLAMLVLAMSMSASAAKAKINKKSQTIGVGDTFTLKVKNAKKVKWSSSDATVAKVTKKGKVTGVKGGAATITGKVDKKSYKCNVTVEEIALDDGLTSKPQALTVGQTLKFADGVKTFPANLEVVVKSSNEAVAKVEAGVVTAVGAGTAEIGFSSKDGIAKPVAFAVEVKVADDVKAQTAKREIVINDENSDELMDKYFGRVVISYIYLDKNGKLLNPENYIAGSVRWKEEADVFKKLAEDEEADVKYATRRGDWTSQTGTSVENHQTTNGFDYYPTIEQTYAYYVKDGTISDLLTYGGSFMQYHLNKYNVDINGKLSDGYPKFGAMTMSLPLGAETNNTYRTGYGTVMVNASEKVSLARMFFPKATPVTFYYDTRTQHNNRRVCNKGTMVIVYTEDGKLTKPVTGIDGKAMLGFDFASVFTTFGMDKNIEQRVQHADVTFDEKTDTLKNVAMLVLEDDEFRLPDFHLWTKK